jgi:hypothetical protein
MSTTRAWKTAVLFFEQVGMSPGAVKNDLPLRRVYSVDKYPLALDMTLAVVIEVTAQRMDPCAPAVAAVP